MSCLVKVSETFVVQDPFLFPPIPISRMSSREDKSLSGFKLSIFYQENYVMHAGDRTQVFWFMSNLGLFLNDTLLVVIR